MFPNPENIARIVRHCNRIVMALIFFADIVLVALASAFVLSLAVKWGILEWLQVHAPNEFFSKMLNCKFCTSFWVAVIVSLIGWAIGGMWYMVFAPIFATVIIRELW